jgi:hypothetical protein
MNSLGHWFLFGAFCLGLLLLLLGELIDLRQARRKGGKR